MFVLLSDRAATLCRICKIGLVVGLTGIWLSTHKVDLIGIKIMWTVPSLSINLPMSFSNSQCMFICHHTHILCAIVQIVNDVVTFFLLQVLRLGSLQVCLRQLLFFSLNCHES
jgi:hypothetical protein